MWTYIKIRGGGYLLRLLLGFIYSAIFVSLTVGPILWIAMLGYKEEHPQEYRVFAKEVLKVGSQSGFNISYEMTTEEEEAAKEIGLDLEAVSLTSAASAWGTDAIEADVGRGVLLSLFGGESAHCSNCGKVDACAEYESHPSLNGEAQCLALENLLKVWKRYDIRAINPIAAEYIYEDYSGALGSKGGGALGCLQFLAGTAFPHLSTVGEPFDLWDELTAMKAAVAELHRLGWQEDLTTIQKIAVLLKWNNSPSWITRIVKTAEQYKAYLGAQRGLTKVFGSSSETGIKAKVLSFLGLMPLSGQEEALANLALDAKGLIQISEKWQIPVKDPIWSSNSEDHTGRGSVPADDFSVKYGTPIFPTGEGVVTITSCNNEGGYGCWVQVAHGDGLSSNYCHMVRGSIAVEVGQKVSKDTVLGQVGWTGKTSFGPHLHFEFRKNGTPVEPASVWGLTPGEMGIPYEKFANVK